MDIATTPGVLGRARRSRLSDEQLLARARQGDGRCFEEIHRRYRSSLFGYCLMRLVDKQAAEDAVQEVFAKATAASGQPVENVKAWLFTIAHNAVTDAVRRHRVIPVLVDLEAVVDSADHAVDETTFAALDVTTNVFIALRRLPTRERRVLTLREFHDKSSREIAEELDTTPSNVDVIISRARSAFGRAYTEIADLPFACRRATETIYREIGSGASDRQLDLMKAHLALCPRCRAEYRRCHAPRYLGGLVPLTWPALGLPGLSPLVAKLKAAAGFATDIVDRYFLPGWSTSAKATFTAVIAATALTPTIAVHVPTRPIPQFVSPLVSLPAGSESTRPGSTADEGHAGSTASSDADWDASHPDVKLCLESHPKRYSDPGHHGTEAYAGGSDTFHSAGEITGAATDPHPGVTDSHTGTENPHGP